jgi:tripartite-type tricarboxylate transporter receptor subunit TctC
MNVGQTIRTAFTALCLMYAGTVYGQPYPSSTVTIVAGFPAGGSVDAVARILANALATELGQIFIVDNKTGATGTIAANLVATSKPDGHTLLIVPGGHALYGATFKTLPFDPVTSFTWVSNVMTTPFYVTVPANSEIKSMADLVAKAKAKPESLKFGSVGPGSPHHLGVELLSSLTGTKFVHVPYRGETPIVTALLGSEVDFSLFTPIQVLSNVEAGKLRALAATTNARSSRLPDVPTVEQSLGIRDYNIGSWFAVAGAAGTPQPIVDRLNAALRKILDLPDVKMRLAALGGDITPSTPSEMRDQVSREAVMWSKVVDMAGLPKQ